MSINIYVGPGNQNTAPYYTFYLADNTNATQITALDISKSYTFHRLSDATSHPFYISDQGYEQASTTAITLSGNGNATTGITGSQTFTVSFNSPAPTNLYYYCTAHSGMIGNFFDFDVSAISGYKTFTNSNSTDHYTNISGTLASGNYIYIHNNMKINGTLQKTLTINSGGEILFVDNTDYTALTQDSVGNLQTGGIRWAVDQWITNSASFIKGGSNQQYGPIELWNTKDITDMSGLFLNKNTFNAEIGDWDVSKVTTMEAMFKGATAFNQSIENWKVSAVTSMYRMFYQATIFNKSLSNWERSGIGSQGNSSTLANVTSMSNMFFEAQAFNQDIGDWDVSSVKNMTGMFGSRRKEMSFNNGGVGDTNLGMDKWNVTSITTFKHMFNMAYSEYYDGSSNSRNEWPKTGINGAFNQYIGSWVVAGIGNQGSDSNAIFGSMFRGQRTFAQDLSGWATNGGYNNFRNNATDWKLVKGMFEDCDAMPNFSVGNWYNTLTESEQRGFTQYMYADKRTDSNWNGWTYSTYWP